MFEWAIHTFIGTMMGCGLIAGYYVILWDKTRKDLLRRFREDDRKARILYPELYYDNWRLVK